jgi:signal transduction histidine kinase
MIDDPKFAEELLERLGQAATLVVDLDGKIIFASKRALRLLGAQKNRILHKDFFAAVKLVDNKGELLLERKHPVWQALQAKAYHQITPFFCRLKVSKNSEPLSVAVRALQMRQRGKSHGAVVELRETKRVLNVGEMKSLFVSFAAHQLKTPSSIVKGFLELMLRQGERSYTHEQWYNLQSAFEANENLINLSKTLLNLTRLEGGLIEPKIAHFNPHSVLQRKIDSHKPLLSVKQMDVKLVASGTASSFPSDETFFLEICEIFLSNALKHSPAGSTITIKCTANNSELRVEVADQGPGVPPGQQEKLFNTAGQSDTVDNSHGLGLLMAKKYVSLLGGSIGLVSGKKQGAAFFFTIPKPLI